MCLNFKYGAIRNKRVFWNSVKSTGDQFVLAITYQKFAIATNTKLLWVTSGKDIFTEGFEIFQDYIEAIDFNNEKYRIEIQSGDSKLV